MRVVHLVTTDFGGAFKAVQRIQDCMRLYHVQSDILVRSQFFETNTIEVMNTPVRRLLSKSRNLFNLLLSHGEVVTDLFGADLTRHSKVKEADVIMLHWVNSFISGTSIRRLAKLHKPIIWVMHDMWDFTGGCHYDWYCGRYEVGCGCCPFLGGRFKKDISYWNLQQKKKLFDKIDITFVAISRWEEKCASNSVAMRGKDIVRIFNPVNIHIFRPLERDKIRAKYKVEDKKVILFGADKALGNPMKGFQYLIEALQYLKGEKYQVVCFGEAPEDKQIAPVHIPVKYLGTIRQEEMLAEWYNAADVFVSPSVQEGFGYTVCEALACGTPAATFAVGGLLDQIVQKQNGYLAKLRDAKDLAEGIVYCIDHRTRLSVVARERVVSHNSYSMIGMQYCKLLEEVISESRRNVYNYER